MKLDREGLPVQLCAGAGLACLAAAMLGAAMGLDLGAPGSHVFVAVVLLLLAAGAVALLRKEGVSRNYLMVMLLPIGAAMLFRMLCLDYASLDYQDFLSRWYQYFKANGGFKAMAASVGDYNAPYLYFMAAISYSDLPDLYLIKLFSMAADVLLAWGGFRLVRVLRGGHQGDPVPLIAFGVLFLLPTVVLNGAYWGQCDAIYGALVLHALAQLLAGKNRSSVILLAVAFSFKLQTIFLIPLWGVLWLARKVKFLDLLLFPATYVVTIIPALLMGKPLKDILGVYFNQMGEYTYSLSLNAPTMFQFIPYGAEVDTEVLPLFGIELAALLVIALLVMGFCLRKGKMTNEIAMAAAAVLAIGVPFFLPYMHERYFFLADVICVCWACANLRHIPAAVLAAGSSLASYLVYLRLKYNCVVRLGGKMYVMGLESFAMLLALVFSAAMLILILWKGRKTDETGIMECERPAGLPEEGISGVDEQSGG